MMKKTSGLQVAALVALGVISGMYSAPFALNVVVAAQSRYTMGQMLAAGWCVIAVVVAWWLSGAIMRMYLMAGFIVASSIQDLRPRLMRLFSAAVIMLIVLALGKWWGLI